MVMNPCSTPKVSSTTLIIDARQFVMQEAFDTARRNFRVELVLVDPDHECGAKTRAQRGRPPRATPAVELGRGLFPAAETARGRRSGIEVADRR